MTEKAPTPPRPLSQDAIVEAAQRLTRQVGVEKLTMRALADALGVSPMAPYHYVDGRDSLLLLVVERVMAGVQAPAPDGDQPWDVQLWEYMQAMGQALAQYPGIADYLLDHELTRAGRQYMRQCIAILVRGGFGGADARTAFILIYTYMWGGSIFQGMQNRHQATGRRRSRSGTIPTIDDLASAQAVEVGYRTIVAGLRTTMATA
ncbi:MAG: TetR/AcrR family transcriptional regulator [Acidimicrobiales bacterium]